MQPLVNHIFATSPSLPPLEGQLYEYVVASNGVFIRGKRLGLEVIFKIADADIRGLASLESYVKLDFPQISSLYLNQMFDAAKRAVNTELLWHLIYNGDSWELHSPEQHSTSVSVQPLVSGIGTSYEKCLIEIHSHHNMSPVFSQVDNQEEVGFRIYGVLGWVRDRPTINLRVGLAGYFTEIPHHIIFTNLPEGVSDFYDHHRYLFS